MDYVFWIVVAVIMGVVEAASCSFISLWFVVGAIGAFVAALLGGDMLVQLVVFLIVSVVCLLAFRPLVLKNRERGKKAEPTVVGQMAIVCEAIDPDRLTGRVETEDHMTWAARSADGSPIPAGENVRIVAQESVKLFVKRMDGSDEEKAQKAEA